MVCAIEIHGKSIRGFKKNFKMLQCIFFSEPLVSQTTIESWIAFLVRVFRYIIMLATKNVRMVNIHVHA